MPESDLSLEILTFESIHEDLMEQFGPDEWVVISASSLQGHFKQFSEAALFVAQNFQDQPTLIRQVESPPVHVPYVMMSV